MATLAGPHSFEPLATTPRFTVEVDGTIIASFSECSGLSATIATEKWEEGGSNHTTFKFPGRADYGNITLKHGVTHSTELYDWFLKVLRREPRVRKPVTIKLVDSQLNEIQSWHFIDAFPVKWSGPTLQAESNDIAIESFELAHNGFLRI
ncbi:MAG TPA: phage tail protein [Dehalococcoidia bacterium]|nr:phage tail protein [Dehalococcoidia bacterium]